MSRTLVFIKKREKNMNQLTPQQSNMKTIYSRCHHYLLTGTCLLFIAAAMILAGCSTGNDNTEPEIASIDISPDSVSIGVGESIDFSVAALDASGDEVSDADVDFRWWSSDESVFTVEDDGTATAQDTGSAFCKIEVPGRPFVGRDSAFVAVF